MCCFMWRTGIHRNLCRQFYSQQASSPVCWICLFHSDKVRLLPVSEHVVLWLISMGECSLVVVVVFSFGAAAWWKCPRPKVPVTQSFFAQPACVNHVHHALTGCHSVSLLPGNSFCDTSACSPTITHDTVSLHKHMQKMACILNKAL